MATAKEFRELSMEDLLRRSGEMKAALVESTMKLRTGTLESTAARLESRRDLARLLTVISEKKAKS